MTKLKDIEGALLDKITSHLDPIFFDKEQKYLKTDTEQRIFGEGFNKGVKSQREVEIGLNRERLARLLHKLHQEDKHAHLQLCWDDENLSKNYYFQKADAIIKNQNELFEVRKG